MKRIFENTGRAFSGVEAATEWLADYGYSSGSMERDRPIGILRGTVNIAKWTNLTNTERRGLHGTICCDLGFKTGSAIVEIRDEFAPVDAG